MLDKHLIVKTYPKADLSNIITWKNYRITVLGESLFRLERNDELIFRDEATQTVWYRNAKPQRYEIESNETKLIISTVTCKLKIMPSLSDCRISLSGGKWQKINNQGNLKGTYRTLDGCDGNRLFTLSQAKYIKLSNGVCSKTGVAVLDDSNSLRLGENGQVLTGRYNGTDEYIFAFGADYRSAVKALYQITGKTPLVPRFALGNWWSRYKNYTHEEYMKVLQRFEDYEVPLAVATVDMDWHYSDSVNEQKGILEQGKNTEFYGCHYKGMGPDANGWTGYSWNKELFPDYKKFLKEVKEKKLKITLNLHPAQGVRWFEDQYEEFARAMDIDPKTEECIKFDIADSKFINNYFKILHKPYEKDGVDFWWIDWQQGTKTSVEGLDPLWLLNHYHYYDQASDHCCPLILSRYAGVGSHRYPLGFSGDTCISWKTLSYLPYFTQTASNVGYTWWSHDIGGHCSGDKDDEMFVRHVQFGVFSPINRLHCTNEPTLSKEPWLFENGTGEIIMRWLKFRHKLIPYLYSASRATNTSGIALIEPLYYEWNEPNAYKYDKEYLFGGQLLVIPIVNKRKKDGYAYVRAWIPQGVWTDIFTGDIYDSPKGGCEKILLRKLDYIPVLARAGAVLPLSLDKGNGVSNPEKMEIAVFNGNGEFTLFEDGREEQNDAEFFTIFKTQHIKVESEVVQKLTITSHGEESVIPKNRVLDIQFKSEEKGVVTVRENGINVPVNVKYGDFVRIELKFKPKVEYEIILKTTCHSEQEFRSRHAYKVLIRAEENNNLKSRLYFKLCGAKTHEEYEQIIDEAEISQSIKYRLKEIL